jgi:hypothetical protein
MTHLEKALFKYNVELYPEIPTGYIQLENIEEGSVDSPMVKFTIQSSPIKSTGVNGVQALDMIKYAKCLIESLNSDFPCKENEQTILKLKEAIFWQEARTIDRMRRDVEGYDII